MTLFHLYTRRSDKMVLLYAVLFLLVTFFSCKQKKAIAEQEQVYDKNIIQTITPASFKKTDNIRLNETGLNGFLANLKVIDTFLLCIDYRSPLVIQVYSTNTNRLLRQFLTRGEQKGQCMGAANILPVDNKLFWLYDITLGKFLKLDITKVLSDSAYWGEEEIILTDSAKKVKSPCLVNDSLFVACTYIRDDCRFITFNKNSIIVDKTGRLPERQKAWLKENKNNKFNILASIYTANLVRHPQKDILIAAYDKTDRLEIYEGGNLKKIVRGPDLFEPVIDFMKEDEQILANETDKTRYSFTCICATNNFFYCLYSGNDNYNSCSQKLLVFDWDGNPVKTVEFDHPICYFTITEKNDIPVIYVLEKETGTVYSAKL